MTRPPRIKLVVLLEELAFGGTQRYALEFLKNIDRTWFEPEVWALRGGEDLLPAMRDAGIEVTYLSKGLYVGPRALLNLASRLRRHRPDVLYTLTVVPNIWGRLFAGLMGIRVVSGYRSLMPNQHERLLSRFSNRIIANAQALKAEMTGRRGVPAEQVSVIPNGVDADYFSPEPARRSSVPLVVCVARLVDEKDIPTLLAAFAHARSRVPDAELEIIGNGPLSFAAPPGVRFLPATDDVRPHLRRAWVFALASRKEASPNVVLEAMACGVPVAATRVGGIPELVADGESGVLVPPRNAAALGDALARLLADRAAREALGEAARRHVVSAFPVARMVRSTERVLREVAQCGSAWTVDDAGEIPPEFALWPASEAPPARSERMVERGRVRADRSLQDVTVPTLTLYRPQAGANGISVVICPGGGYAALSIDKEGHDVARWFAARGMVAAVLKYRLPNAEAADASPPWPMQDVMRAVEMMREHAPEWGVDPRRVGVMGFSAGGHMAAAAARMDPELAFAVVVYPVISMEARITHKGSRLRLLGPHPDAASVERYSYERHVTEATCPTFLVHARDDDVAKADNSLAYAEALRRAGVAHELLLYETAGHGFGLGVRGGEAAQWPGRCIAWLKAREIIATDGPDAPAPPSH